MDRSTPEGARTAARVLVFDGQNRVLLLEAQDPSGGHRWWIAPGGGVQVGESFEQAAQRELYEETGLELQVDRWVWTRRHVYTWQGRAHDQYERYFIARSTSSSIIPVKADDYVVGYRWWLLPEIERSAEDFTPRRIAALLSPILRGEDQDFPIDCGV
jgi:8-oxo-dGTP pyrophosphatase MutT (NUDIX family)